MLERNSADRTLVPWMSADGWWHTCRDCGGRIADQFRSTFLDHPEIQSIRPIRDSRVLSLPVHLDAQLDLSGRPCVDQLAEPIACDVAGRIRNRAGIVDT